MNDITILYVTGNHEKPEFEKKIIDQIREVSGDHPVISVSQKPIDLGDNICVGDIGVTYANAYRQMLTGAKKVKTEYIMVAESDQLYPPGYFDFVPSGDKLYIYDNLWVLRYFDKNKFKRKCHGSWLGAFRKDYFIRRISAKVRQDDHSPGIKIPDPFPFRSAKRFDVGLPVITVKTRENISKNTGTEDECARSLPHWGGARSLGRKLKLF